MSLFSTKISKKEYDKALKIIEAYEKQQEKCCCSRNCCGHCDCCSCDCHSCACKPIKIGCLVKYTDEAHRQIGNVVDHKIRRVRKVIERKEGSPLFELCDGKCSDSYWLEHA